MPPPMAVFCPSQDARGTASGTHKCCVLSHLRDLSQNFAKKFPTTYSILNSPLSVLFEAARRRQDLDHLPGLPLGSAVGLARPMSVHRPFWRRPAADKRSVACFARSEIFVIRVTVGHGGVFCNTWGSMTHEPRPHCNAASHKNDRATKFATEESSHEFTNHISKLEIQP